LKPFLQFANECLSAEWPAGALGRAYRVARGGIEALAQERLRIAGAIKQRRRRDQSVVPRREVHPRAGPTPVARSPDKLSPHGVQLNIARTGKKTFFIYGKRGKTSLPGITAPALAEINFSGVAPVGLGERCPQPLLVGRYKNKMNMVRH